MNFSSYRQIFHFCFWTVVFSNERRRIDFKRSLWLCIAVASVVWNFRVKLWMWEWVSNAGFNCLQPLFQSSSFVRNIQSRRWILQGFFYGRRRFAVKYGGERYIYDSIHRLDYIIYESFESLTDFAVNPFHIRSPRGFLNCPAFGAFGGNFYYAT